MSNLLEVIKSGRINDLFDKDCQLNKVKTTGEIELGRLRFQRDSDQFIKPKGSMSMTGEFFLCLLLITTGIAKLDVTLDEAGKQGLLGAGQGLFKLITALVDLGDLQRRTFNINHVGVL